MSRSARLWLTAIALTALPQAYALVRSLLPASGSRGYGVGRAFYGQCTGFTDVWMRTQDVRWLLDRPLLLVAPLFAVWLITRATRTIGWITIGALLVVALYEPLIAAYDITENAGCAQFWRSFSWWRHLYFLLPALSLWLTVRGPSRRAQRMAVALLLLAGLIAADHGASRTRTPCRYDAIPRIAHDETPLQAISRMPEARREAAFLCAARGLPAMPSRAPSRSDEDLLGVGRSLCEARTTPPSLLMAVQRAWAGADPLRTAAYLCPAAMGRQVSGLNRSQAQDDQEGRAYRQRIEAACKHRPQPGAYRWRTHSLFTSEGGGYYVGDVDSDGMAAFEAGLKDGLVGVADGQAAVMTGDENSSICVTAAAYRRRPPLRLKGWEHVVEVGIVSTVGRVMVSTLEERIPLPVLSSGRGSYRLRVYVRGSERARTSLSELPVEEHLVVVFPGRGPRRIAYR